MERIRRRRRHTRARAKRTRPKTRAPTAGWLIRELSQLTEVSVRPEQGSAPGATFERWSAQVQAWRRVQHLPGLELLLGPDASPAAARAASKIFSEYLG
jgi:hypothetical protein